MNEPLHVLYLDFDGVLHPEDVRVSARRGIHLVNATGHVLFENAQLLIDALAPYPGVRIVLSTSWVRSRGYMGARKFLPESLQRRCIGATFHSRYHDLGRDLGWPRRLVASEHLRGEEVRDDWKRRRPERWLAVDDTDEGWAAEDREHLVLSHPMLGICHPAVAAELSLKLRRFGPAN